jgi:hypothetical protein
MPRSDRDGFALLLCLMLALALSLLAAGMLLLADRETRIASGTARLVQARLHAEGAARRAFGRWSTAAAADLPIGGRRTILEDAGARVVAERLDDGLFLLRSEGRAAAPETPAARIAAGLLVRTAGTDILTAGARAAIAVAESATLRGGRISGIDACTGEAWPGVTGPDVQIEAGAAVQGVPAVDGESAGPDLLEAFPVTAVATVALPPGSGTPQPDLVDAQCQQGNWNWGSPGEEGPCSGHRPLVHAAGDLVIRGGRGQGVLVVDGNLTVSDGFSFRGLIVVRGRLRIDDAVLSGGVRARQVEMSAGAVTFDSCALTAAGTGPAFDRAFRPRGRWWIPAF